MHIREVRKDRYYSLLTQLCMPWGDNRSAWEGGRYRKLLTNLLLTSQEPSLSSHLPVVHAPKAGNNFAFSSLKWNKFRETTYDILTYFSL
jgi:hypothetical protein